MALVCRVVLFGDQIPRTWGQITQFRPDTAPAKDLGGEGSPDVDLPNISDIEVEVGGRVMRDERGVYLAPELDD